MSGVVAVLRQTEVDKVKAVGVPTRQRHRHTFTRPALHPQEQDRLRVLHGLGVLDTPAEHRFDHLTRMVQTILGFPTVLVSLVDQNRQWFKSRIGMEAAETDRDIAFCAYAVANDDDILIIPDALADPRFRDTPLVTAPPYIRFYAGAVLRSPEGLPLGTLCVIDYQPRHLTTQDTLVLRDFASLVEAELCRDATARPNGRIAPPARAGRSPWLAMPNADFRTAADEILVTEASDKFVCMKLGFPKAPKIALTLGRDVVEDMHTEVARRVRTALINRRFILGYGVDATFACLIELNPGDDSIRALADDIERSVGKRIQTQDNTVFTPIAVGLAAIDRDATTMDDAIHHGRIAMNGLGKHFVGCQSAVFHDSMHRAQVRRSAVASRIEAALLHNDMQMHYQPKVCLAKRRVVGAEALLRWPDPDLGQVSPLEVVDAAHEIDMTVELEKWVFQTVATQVRRWLDQDAPVGTISINVSASTLMSREFADMVALTMRRLMIPPRTLEFEILESAILHNLDEAVVRTLEYKNLGIVISLDDFGTGHSSLSYLQILPIDALKIDRSFIHGIAQDAARSTMARQIVDIGQALGKQVVAEGVECEAEAEILKSFGCDFGQGFYFGAALPANRFSNLAEFIS